MTLWVSREDQDVVIHGNVNLSVILKNGNVQEWSVREHYMHLRHTWRELGLYLDEAELEAEEAKAALVPKGEEYPKTEATE